MNTNIKETLKSFEGIKNSHAIEGLYLTRQDEAFFRAMIEKGLNDEERKKAINKSY